MHVLAARAATDRDRDTDPGPEERGHHPAVGRVQ